MNQRIYAAVAPISPTEIAIFGGKTRTEFGFVDEHDIVIFKP